MSAAPAASVALALDSLRRRAEQIRAAELARANGRLTELAPADRRALDALTQAIVDAFLRSPTERLAALSARPDGHRYSAALRHLFALEETP